MMEQHQPTPTSPADSSAHGVATSESETRRRRKKRQPRNSACQGCAALKMKCIATNHGKCERCDRMNRECLPAVPKPRNKRRANTLSHPTSQQAVPLSAILQANSSPCSPSARSDPVPHVDHHRTAYASARSHETQYSHRHTNSLSPIVTLLSQGLGGQDTSNVAICGELLSGIDSQFVTDSFAIFHQLAHHFPFVDVSADTDVMSMITYRPLLTVAVCTVATLSRPEAQDRLSRAFTYGLSSHMMFDGAKSMDVLSGLMVYLAWSHHYTSQKQIYQHLCLLAGLVADMGLYQSRPPCADRTESLEQGRAFIGSYYLCSHLSAIGFCRPNPLRWTTNLRHCADYVARLGLLPTDRSIGHVLEIGRTLDMFEDDLRDVEQLHEKAVFAQISEMHARKTNSTFDTLKRTSPTPIKSLAFNAAIAHVHYKTFCGGRSFSSQTLAHCVYAIRVYLEDMFLHPPSTLHHCTIADWTSLLEILVLLSRVASAPVNGDMWDVQTLGDALQPDVVFDSLYAQMAAASSEDPLMPRNETLLNRFQGICESLMKQVTNKDKIFDNTKQQALGDRRFRPSGDNRSNGKPRVHSISYALTTQSEDTFESLPRGILDAAFWQRVS